MISSSDKQGRSVLFCSFHGLLDPSSGAAISMRQLLQMLRGRGWDCSVLCGPELDYNLPPTLENLLAGLQLPRTVKHCTAGPHAFQMWHVDDGGMPVCIYDPGSLTPAATIAHGYPFIAIAERLMERDRPDVILTYGGNWMGQAIIHAAKRAGCPVVFWLRNCSYRNDDLFLGADGCIVPCEFSRQFYLRTLGLQTTTIPSPIDWRLVRCEHREGQYVTFVNPQLIKGAGVFVRIAIELQRRRPDIPLLVIEGRADASWIRQAMLEAGAVPEFRVMPNTPDPREFYRITKLILMPSLWDETFARVPVEAFINGIPVLASRRGGLQENLAEAGLLFDIPARYDGLSPLVPTAEEVSPWIESIIHLWDDPESYRRESDRCIAASNAWRSEALIPRYEAALQQAMDSAVADGALDLPTATSSIAKYLPPAAAARAAELTSELLESLLQRSAPRAAGARQVCR